MFFCIQGACLFENCCLIFYDKYLCSVQTSSVVSTLYMCLTTALYSVHMDHRVHKFASLGDLTERDLISTFMED